MKYLINSLPYQPPSLVYFIYEGKVGVGEVTDVIVRYNKDKETIEYKVKDVVNPEPTYYFLEEGRLGYDLDTVTKPLVSIMELAIKDRKEDIFSDVD